MRETAALAAAEGVAFEPGFVERQLGFVDGLHGDMRSSMLHDLLAGRLPDSATVIDTHLARWLGGREDFLKA